MIRFPAGKLEYEVLFQNRKLRYYLPEAFERIERGGYQLGNNRYWITKIRDPKYETTNGNIPHMLHTLKVTDSEQRQDYETLLNSSAIFALEHVKFIL